MPSAVKSSATAAVPHTEAQVPPASTTTDVPAWQRMKITPIEGKAFGATITDVDLANLDEETWAVIHQAYLQFGVLHFPGQHLTKEAQSAFGARFGEFEAINKGGIFTLSNQKGKNAAMKDAMAEGKEAPTGPTLVEVGSLQWISLVGNEGWHNDSTYTPFSSKAGLLSMQQKPPSGGGQTGFCDCRAAYDALSDDMKAKIEGMWAHHSLHYSQAQIGAFDLIGTGYGLAEGEVYKFPLVKYHPETGRPALFCGRHAFGIPGMSPDESEAFIESIRDFAISRPEWTFDIDWEVGDIAVWDNRCIFHRARPYNYNEPRMVRGTRIAGEASEAAMEPLPSEEAKEVLRAELKRLRGKIAPVNEGGRVVVPKSAL